MEGHFPLLECDTPAGAAILVLRKTYPGSRLDLTLNFKQYIMDGYHVSHDPAQPFTKEPTTGRSLNILDVPQSAAPASLAAKRNSHRQSMEIPKGRSLSPSKIIHPKPSKPYASRRVREADYSTSPGLDDLTSQLEQASLYNKLGKVSPASSVGSDISSRSSGGSSLSSLSDPSSSGSGSCRCNRYGVTRRGDRVKLDCGGSRCGYSDDSSSDCSSIEDSASDSEPEVRHTRPLRRAEIRRR